MQDNLFRISYNKIMSTPLPVSNSAVMPTREIKLGEKEKLAKNRLNLIYEKDCLVFMDELPGESLDVIVTSPPYNLHKKYSKYKDNKENGEYVAWMGLVAEKSKRVLKDDGSFFLNIVGSPSEPWVPFDVAKEFSKYFKLQNTIHWVKAIALPKESTETKSNSNGLNGDISLGHFKPINTPKYLNQCHEYIFHFTKNGTVELDKLAIGVPYQHESNRTRWKTKSNKRDRGNIWFVRYENKQGAFTPIVHPAVFPEKIPYLCVKLHGIAPEMIVYDPFMGIGTTALACLRLGVSFLGTEIDPRYVKEAEKAIFKRKQDLLILKSNGH
ncbi:MAG: site-specific DNA-methyltransferase [Elusimicrobia bacterium]|nr:site-specific DNA-methyltransferase [Elusimicrobiota bacterium]